MIFVTDDDIPGELSVNRYAVLKTEENKTEIRILFRSEYEKHMLHMIVLDKNEFIHISDRKKRERAM